MTTFQKSLYPLFFVVGYFSLIKSIISALMNIEAKNWLKIKASMFETKIETKYDEEGGDTYKVKVIYGYKYQKGNEAKVYVNPRKPRVSVLMAKLRYFHIMAVLLSSTFVLIIHVNYNTILPIE